MDWLLLGLKSMNNKKTVFFWIDGMAESVHPTSLFKANIPVIQCLSDRGVSGLYHPFQRMVDSEPHTDVVIPNMLTKDLDFSNSRALLELIDSGFIDLMKIDGNLISFRIVDSQSNDQPNLYFLPKTRAIELEQDIRRNWLKTNFKLVRSPFSRHNNLFYLFDLGSESTLYRIIRDQLELFLSRKGYSIRDWTHEPPLSIPECPHKIAFMGWGDGSIKGAFRVLGANIYQTKLHKRFDLVDYELGINYHRSYFSDSFFQNHDVFIYYFKETDTLSHKARQEEKVFYLELIDSWIGKILSSYPQDFQIVVIGDHITDIGYPKSSSGPVPFLISSNNLSNSKKQSMPFNEASLLKEISKPISQNRLKKIIFD